MLCHHHGARGRARRLGRGALGDGRGLLVQARNDSQRLPLAHAGLPNLSLGINDGEPKQVIQLFQRHDLHFVRRELDVPLVSVDNGGRVTYRPIVPARGFSPHDRQFSSAPPFPRVIAASSGSSFAWAASLNEKRLTTRSVSGRLALAKPRERK